MNYSVFEHKPQTIEEQLKEYNISDGLNSMKMCQRYRATGASHSPYSAFDGKQFYFHPESNRYFCKEFNKIYQVNSLLDKEIFLKKVL